MRPGSVLFRLELTFCGVWGREHNESDAGACVIAFSTTDRASFDDIGKWKKKVEAECGTRLPMVLIQNKIDLIDQAVMTRYVRGHICISEWVSE